MPTTADFASLLLPQEPAVPPGCASRSWTWPRPHLARPHLWGMSTQVILAALLVLTCAGSAGAMVPDRPGGPGARSVLAAANQNPVTPAAVPGPIVEFLWEANGAPSFPLDGPTGMAVDPQGNLWVTDSGNGRFVIFSPDGVALETWGTPGSGDGEFNFTCGVTRFGGVAFDALGNIYVAEGNKRIQKFAPDRTFLTSWSNAGSAGNQMLDAGRRDQDVADEPFVCPVALAVDDQGHVFVSDQFANTIDVFSPDGRSLVAIPVEFMLPEAVALDSGGDIWVADTSSRILQFAAAGRLLSKWDTVGEGAGELNTPMGIAVDDHGRVFVTDWGAQVQVFSLDGAFLGAWGSHGHDAEAFEDPVAVLLDGQGDVYVAEHRGDRVQKFRLLPPFAPE